MKKLLLALGAVTITASMMAATMDSSVDASKPAYQPATVILSVGGNYLFNVSKGNNIDGSSTDFKQNNNWGFQGGVEAYYNLTQTSQLGFGGYYASASYKLDNGSATKDGSMTSIPIYAAYKQLIGTSDLQPYFVVRAGYAFNNFSETSELTKVEAQNGLFLGAGVGFQLQQHLNLELAYSYQQIPMKATFGPFSDTSNYNASKVGVTIGYAF